MILSPHLKRDVLDQHVEGRERLQPGGDALGRGVVAEAQALRGWAQLIGDRREQPAPGRTRLQRGRKRPEGRAGRRGGASGCGGSFTAGM